MIVLTVHRFSSELSLSLGDKPLRLKYDESRRNDGLSQPKGSHRKLIVKVNSSKLIYVRLDVT